MFLGQGLSLAVQSIYFISLARLLGSAQYGVLVAITALVSLLSPYGSLGAGLVLMRYVSPDRTLFRQYWGNALLTTATIGTCITLALTIAGKDLIKSADITTIALLALSDCIFGQITSCASQVFQSFEQMKFSAALILVTNGLRMLCAVLMFITLHQATAAQWAIASVSVSAIATCFALVSVTMKFGSPNLDPRLAVSRSCEGIVFALSNSTNSAYNDIDKAMLGHYGFASANGIYSTAYRIVDIGTIPIRAIHSAAFPKFFRCGADGVVGTTNFARRVLSRTLPIGVLSTIGMFISAPVIPVLLGSSFRTSVNALRLLCPLPILRCIHLSAADAVTGAGKQNIRLGWQACAAVGNFLSNLYLIPKYSLWGAAWASLATDGALAVATWVILLRLKAQEESRVTLEWESVS